jgi:hypothetical protein
VTRGGKKPNAGVVENISERWGSGGIGALNPTGAGENGSYEPDTASSESIGRGRAICEYDEIMQILPGSSNDRLFINASRMICNTDAHRQPRY